MKDINKTNSENSRSSVSQNFVPGDEITETIKETNTESMVNVMETSYFGLATAIEEVSVTNFTCNNKPLTKADLSGLKLNYF